MLRHLCNLLILLTALGLIAPRSFYAGEEEKKDGEKEEEKPKEKPFKYSAWCAFRDLGGDIKEPLKDAKKEAESEQTRRIADQWKGFGRRGHWASIVLELKNTTEVKDDITYKGTCRILLNPLRQNDYGIDAYTTTYRQEFEVGPQSEKQYRFSVMCPEDGSSNAVSLQITAGGRSYETRSVLLHDLMGQDFIVVVSESSGAFRHLMTKPKQRSDFEDESKERDRRVAVVEPAELPARWHDLTLADLIIIDGPPREKLTDAQWDALKSYVQAGGNILITAGKDPSRLAGRLEELAGISAKGMVEVDRIDSIYPPYPPDLPNARAGWKLPLVEVKVAADAKALSDIRYNRKNRYVEMCKRYYGAGSVTFLPFSLSDKVLENWEGRTSIPLSILDAGRGRSVFEREHEEDISTPTTPKRYPWGVQQAETIPGTATMSGLRYALDESFSKDTPVQMQKPQAVLSFLLLYLLCAVPGNYLLFGWFKRREVAWLAVPVWGVTFCGVAYAIGYMGQTGRLTVNEVSVVEAGPDQSVGASRTFVGLYAPRRDDYRIYFPPIKVPIDATFDVQAAPGHLINVQQAQGRSVEQPEIYLVDNDTGLSIEKLRVQQRATRRLEVVHRVNLGQGWDVRLKADPSGKSVFDVEVQNNTPYALYNPVLMFEGKAVELAETDLQSPTRDVLREGASYKAAGIGAGGPAWKEANAIFFGKKPIFVRGEHARKRVEAVNNYAREHLEKFKGAVVCAWIGTPVLPVAVAAGRDEPDKPGQFEGLTLLVAPVPIKDSTAPIDEARKYNARYSIDYDLATNAGQWLPLAEKTAPLKQSTAGQVTNLEIAVPENYRQLQQARFQLQVTSRLALALGKVPRAKMPKPGQALSGEMKIQVKNTANDGRTRWQDVDIPGLFELQADKPWKVPPLSFRLEDYSLRANDVIHVRFSATLSNSALPLELQNVEVKAARMKE